MKDNQVLTFNVHGLNKEDIIDLRWRGIWFVGVGILIMFITIVTSCKETKKMERVNKRIFTN